MILHLTSACSSTACQVAFQGYELMWLDDEPGLGSTMQIDTLLLQVLVRVAYLSAPSPRWISPRSQMVVPVGGQQGELVDW